MLSADYDNNRFSDLSIKFVDLMSEEFILVKFVKDSTRGRKEDLYWIWCMDLLGVVEFDLTSFSFSG